MKDRTKFLIVAVAFLFIMAGCGTVEERPSPDSRPPAAMPTPTPVPFLAPQSGTLFIVNGASVTIFKDGVASQPADRLIVRNVSVSMLVDDISATLEAISAVASGVGGFVVDGLHPGRRVLPYPHRVDALQQGIKKGSRVVPVKKLPAQPVQGR